MSAIIFFFMIYDYFFMVMIYDLSSMIIFAFWRPHFLGIYSYFNTLDGDCVLWHKFKGLENQNKKTHGSLIFWRSKILLAFMG